MLRTPLAGNLVPFSQENLSEKMQDSVTKRKIKISWELAMGTSYLTNTSAFLNHPSKDFYSTSFHYYASVKIPLIQNHDRFGIHFGVGPNVKNFGLNKLLTITNNKLTFSDVPSNSAIKAVNFQQLTVDFPLYLYYETKSGRRGYHLSVEWGGIFGIQASNKWTTYEVNNGITTITSQQDIPNTKNLQFGSSVKCALVKHTKLISSGLFIQGTYYSTSTFKSDVKLPTNSYDIRIGIYVTLNKL